MKPICESKKIIFLVLAQIFCTTGFSQNLQLKDHGTHIPARANLDVRWNVPTDMLPTNIWIYQLLPNRLSPEVISSVMKLCAFTEKDEVENNTNGIVFESADHSRTLSISFSTGSIRYDTPEPHYVLKPNFFKGVPQMEEMPRLTKNFLKTIGIPLSEIQKNTNDKPNFRFFERGYEYFSNRTAVTNTWARAVRFSRAVDKVAVIGNTCELYFGEHGKISKIDFSWPNLKRVKSYRTISPKEVINSLRNGNAIRGPVPTSVGDFDWQDVKSVTITKAIPSYMVIGGQLYPFLRMDVTVDIGGQNVRLAMDCPIFDESKL